jgi:hypothetical protein
MSARTMLQMAEVTVGALEAIEKIAHVGGPKADAALAAIRGVLSALKGLETNAISPQVILGKIEDLRDAVAANDAAALEEIHKRFGTPS